MTTTTLLSMSTSIVSRPRQRLARAGLACLMAGLLLVASPASAADGSDADRVAAGVAHDIAGRGAADVADGRADGAPVADVSSFDARIVAGAPESLGEVVQSGPPPEIVEFYAHDAIGSVRMVFDPSGNVVGQTTYSPFGVEIAGATGMPSQRFTGQERDHEAQLDYFNARSYQSRTGRFASVDPLFAGAPADPQRWNRYAYALNNPLMMGDPTGLQVAYFPSTKPGSVCVSCIEWMAMMDRLSGWLREMVWSGGWDWDDGGSGGGDGGVSAGGGDSPVQQIVEQTGTTIVTGGGGGEGGNGNGNGGNNGGQPTEEPELDCIDETRLGEASLDLSVANFAVTISGGVWEQSRNGFGWSLAPGGFVGTVSAGHAQVNLKDPKPWGWGLSGNRTVVYMAPDRALNDPTISVTMVHRDALGGGVVVDEKLRRVGYTLGGGMGLGYRTQTRMGLISGTIGSWGTCGQ